MKDTNINLHNSNEDSLVNNENNESVVTMQDIKHANELLDIAKTQLHRANVYYDNSEREKKHLKKRIDLLEDEIVTYQVRAKHHVKMLNEKDAKIRRLESAINDHLEITSSLSNIEKHLNEVLNYMPETAKSAGVSVSNAFVRVCERDGKIHVNLKGEVRNDGVSPARSGHAIKAVLYDRAGNIEIEGKYSLSYSFTGFDTFDIGWSGGTRDSWVNVSMVRLFVV